jgi:ATP-dependent RNA helicase DeaD
VNRQPRRSDSRSPRGTSGSRGGSSRGSSGPRSGAGARSGGRSGGRSRGGPPRERKPKIDVKELEPILDAPEIESFDHWDLGDEVLDALFEMEVHKPTPIQRLAIQPVLDGRDVIAKAETGTGKTIAFGAPMISKVDAARSTVLGMVLCPTRELAQQVQTEFKRVCAHKQLHTVLLVGGEPLRPQIEELRKGAQIVVGTPGRVLDLAQQGFLSFPWCEFAVLDEADKMFEIGFIDDIRKILGYLPEERQTLLFSATYPPELLQLAREGTRDPIEVATAAGHATVENIEQLWMKTDEEDRELALKRILEQSEEDEFFLVFVDRRTEATLLHSRMRRLPFDVYALHGGYDQEVRFKIMQLFREKKVKALIATDVASRGLDVEHVTHVVNFNVPRELPEYTHRIGRTGRAGRRGTAITFVTPRGQRSWDHFMRKTGWTVHRVPVPRRGDRGRGRDAALRDLEILEQEKLIPEKRDRKKVAPVPEEPLVIKVGIENAWPDLDLLEERSASIVTDANALLELGEDDTVTPASDENAATKRRPSSRAKKATTKKSSPKKAAQKKASTKKASTKKASTKKASAKKKAAAPKKSAKKKASKKGSSKKRRS